METKLGARMSKGAWRHICDYTGTDQSGKERTVTVRRRGRSVQIEMFTERGLPLTHLVHPSNEGSAEGHKREILLCWHLTDLKRKPPT